MNFDRLSQEELIFMIDRLKCKFRNASVFELLILQDVCEQVLIEKGY